MKNLLFVSIEDLNDYVEPLGGHPESVTPNITRLARDGMLFSSTHASAPACSPSRTAVLFGSWPWDSGVYTNQQTWHSRFRPNHDLSLIGLLRRAGYETHGAGKMFYGGIADSEWSTYLKEPNDPNMRQSLLQQRYDIAAAMLDYGPSRLDGPLYDERNTRHMLNLMTPGSTGQVWSLGIYRPHLPFVAPQRFFDLYPETVLPAPALKNRNFNPESGTEISGLPREARRRMIKNSDFANRLHECGQYNDFLRSYLASISYADYLLGLLLDHLEETGLRDTTQIVLWSDHGYHFGEKNLFHKFTLWERSLRTPMIFAGPGVVRGEYPDPVSNVDLGRTVMSLLGVDATDSWAGTDLSPILKGQKSPSHTPVISVYGFPRTPMKNKRAKVRSTRSELALAWSIRVPEWRLVRYWGRGTELYDHRVDPFEHHNLIPDGLLENASRNLQVIAGELVSAIPANPAPSTIGSGRRISRSREPQLPHWARSVRWTRDA